MAQTPVFQPVRHRRIYEDIVRQIQELIADRHLQPGDRLPPERELAETLSVSRASVREALRVLNAMGLVEVRSGDGTFIRSAHAPVDPAVWALLPERQFLLDLLQARRIVEEEIVALAVHQATQDDLDQMQDLLNRRERELAEGKADLETDLLFHRLIAEATRNPVLVSIVRTLNEIWLQSREATGRAPTSPHKAQEFHQAIVEAIRMRDEALARGVMHRHMEDMREDIERQLHDR
ncbi:MAG: FadR/GntR family transcriptional regulator [Armatimonadota bacterium]|nr:FadR/GntR family transcriptional regulator [Armatimonadota bacterium]MDR5696992.1 FadR/GntR family transcriptional regulator [Armatimonadota bacterium]